MNEILKELKENLALDYIGIFSKEGFIVFEEKADYIESELLAGELSVILKNSKDFSEEAMATEFESLLIKMKNGKGVCIDNINEDFFIVSVLSKKSIFTKYNYYIKKEKKRIGSVL